MNEYDKGFKKLEKMFNEISKQDNKDLEELRLWFDSYIASLDDLINVQLEAPYTELSKEDLIRVNKALLEAFMVARDNFVKLRNAGWKKRNAV